MSAARLALTWLGHSAFHLQASGGPSFLIDPWLDNPKAPANAAALAETASIVLLTHGHSDHIGGTVDLVKRTGAVVLSSYEVTAELGADGVAASQLIGFNKGGTVTRDGLTVTLTQAFHSSSLIGADGRARSVGDPCGLIIALANGLVLYDTGDTCVFGDMQLLAELYRPDVLMLPIGDFYTMGPRQAAKACELVQPSVIVPHHYGTFPALAGTPDQLRERLPETLRSHVRSPAPGETITVS